EFTITGKNGVLRRGEEGFSAFQFTSNDCKRANFSLNDTEARLVEPLWIAAKNATKVVRNSVLLRKAAKDHGSTGYEYVSKVFSKSGKAFYEKFVDHDMKGNYWLNLDKI